jgi:hypothetical protein
MSNWKDFKSASDLNNQNIDTIKNEILEDISIFIEKNQNNRANLISLFTTLNAIVSEKSDDFFLSKEAEYIFYLTQLEGEARRKKLNANRKLYRDKIAAKKWRDQIYKFIHEDRCCHALSKEACQQLDEMYEGMINDLKK